MDRIEFFNNLEDLIEADAGSLAAHSVLADIPGWDSMAIMGFIAFADEALGITPAPQAIKSCQTVGDLMILVGI
ncbi:MAG: hypothetical protein Q8O19_00285 [Rectinemataceae bacterium]|nr:hypothetical protein [Rectinemataceae bacterium]